MSIQEVVSQAQEYMREHDVDGWLLYDYRGLNPIFADTVGSVSHVTRPVWLWIPASGNPRLLLSFVDQSRFEHLDLDTTLFINRRDMIEKLRSDFGISGRVAMEYTPEGALPRVSNVDGGTLEFVEFDDPYTTNICFGGPDLATALVTLSWEGRLVAMDWPRPGLPLNFLNI